MPQDAATVKVFRDYTQEELDWQYDHSKRFDTGIFQEQRTEASRAARDKVKGLLNVAYGDHEDEVLDIFPAEEGRDKTPVIVFFHGGAWTRGSKNGYSFPAVELAPRGIAWVATEFTRVPQGTLSNQVRQNRDAVAWVYRNAEKYGFDRDRIFIAGHSSGGHNCGMVLVTDWEKQYGLPKNLVKGAVAISGMYDLEAVYLSYRNEYLHLTEEEWRANSAILHIPSDYGAPLIIGCAEHDTAEFHRQPEEFLAAWNKAGHQGEWIELMDRHHFTGSMCFGEPGHPLFQKLLKMVEEG